MKFVVTKEDFIRDLSIADSIINVKTPLAMLLNIYIEAFEDGTIIILAYNGQDGVKVETTGVVEKEGKVSLLSKKLLEVIRRIPAEKIVFESKPDNETEIMVHPEGLDNPLFNINGVSADAYPIFTEFNWEDYILVSQETLHEQIVGTDFAVSTDMSKPAFTGTYIEESVDGFLSFVATDGKRLAVIMREYEQKNGSVESGVIIPEKIFKTILTTLATGDVQFSVHKNQAFFKIGKVYIFSTLVEGKFPNYNDVIPSEEINKAVIAADTLHAAIDNVAVMSDPDSGKIKVEFATNKVIVSTRHPIHGLARQELELEYNGNDIAIAINYRSLADFLKVVSGKKVQIIINSQSSPLLLYTVDDQNYKYVTMPMKLTD